MRRYSWILVPILIVIAAMALVLIATVFVTGMLGLASFLHLRHRLGMDNQASEHYASASGVLPVMVTLLGFSGIFVTAYRHLNCVDPGCPRIGRHPDAHGRKWCWRHHPDHDGSKPTREFLHALHHEHKKTG